MWEVWCWGGMCVTCGGIRDVWEEDVWERCRVRMDGMCGVFVLIKRNQLCNCVANIYSTDCMSEGRCFYHKGWSSICVVFLANWILILWDRFQFNVIWILNTVYCSVFAKDSAFWLWSHTNKAYYLFGNYGGYPRAVKKFSYMYWLS